MIIKNKLLLVIISILFAINVSLYSEENKSEKTKKKDKFVALPVIFYLPETSLVFGGILTYYFKLDENDENKYSLVQPTVIYSLKDQIIFRIYSGLYFFNNKNKIDTEINFIRWPDQFYGIGNNTSESSKENYTQELVYFYLSYKRIVWRSLEIGIGYSLLASEVVKKTSGGMIDSNLVIGSDTTFLSALGYFINWDTRDSEFTPMEGSYYQFFTLYHHEYFGSDVNFDRYTVDLRQYIKLLPNHSIGFQGMLMVKHGEIPFYYMSELGGPNFLRGYYKGRYRDEDSLIFQAEYRIIPLFWRIGIVGFMGIGQVAGHIKQFNYDRFHFAGGFGIRIRLSSQPHTNVRIDLGFSEDGNIYPYLFYYEAF